MRVRVSPFAPRKSDSESSKESSGMQTTLETLGQLERRLARRRADRADRGRGAEAPGEAGQDGEDRRLPPGQGAAEDGRAAVRPAGALGRDHRHGADELQRRDSRAEPARRRATRASSRRKRPPTDQFEFSAIFEVYPEVKLGRPVGACGSSGRWRRVEPTRRRPHARDPAQAARALRDRRARRRRRAIA